MNNFKEQPRLERIKDELLDHAENEFKKGLKKLISRVINDANTQLEIAYEKWKSGQLFKPKYLELLHYGKQ